MHLNSGLLYSSGLVSGEYVAYLGHDYRGNYEKGSNELKSGDLSFEDEFVERSRDDRPEGSQYDPNGGRYEHQPVKVDVVVDCKTKDIISECLISNPPA